MIDQPTHPQLSALFTACGYPPGTKPTDVFSGKEDEEMNNQPAPDLAELLARAKTAEGIDLCCLSAVHVMGWEEDRDTPDGILYGWLGEGAPAVANAYRWRPDQVLDIAATLEAEIERRSLLGKYMEALGHMILPDSHLGFPINRFEVGKMVMASALARTRAAVIVAIKAKMEEGQDAV